ncbi:MAG: hypothetical protein NVS2B7_29730 [Herpetosiphon sp.]
MVVPETGSPGVMDALARTVADGGVAEARIVGEGATTGFVDVAVGCGSGDEVAVATVGMAVGGVVERAIADGMGRAVALATGWAGDTFELQATTATRKIARDKKRSMVRPIILRRAQFSSVSRI